MSGELSRSILRRRFVAALIQGSEHAALDWRAYLEREWAFLSASLVAVSSHRRDHDVLVQIHAKRHAYARRLDHVAGVDEDGRTRLVCCGVVVRGDVDRDDDGDDAAFTRGYPLRIWACDSRHCSRTPEPGDSDCCDWLLLRVGSCGRP